MRKTMKHIVLGSAVAGTALFGAAANAGWSANVGAVTNYLWRGVTQSADGPAVQGGLDYGHDSGFYAGTWMSNVDFSGSSDDQELELDLYAGFGGGDEFTWDVGGIYYLYPYTEDGQDLDQNGAFAELYFNGGWQWLSFGAAYTIVGTDSCDDTPGSAFCDGDIYAYVGADFEVGNEVGVGLNLGTYMLEEGEWTPGEDSYIHYGVSLSKSDFTIALEANDLDADVNGKALDSPRFWVGYAKEFDL